MRTSLVKWNVWIVRDGNLIARPVLLAVNAWDARKAAMRMFKDECPSINPNSYDAIVERK